PPVTEENPEPGQEPDPVLAIAAGLAESFDAMADQLGKVGERQDRADRRDRRQRLLVRGLAVSFALDLAVTGGLAYNTIRQDSVQAAQDASQAAQDANDVRQCQLANVARR